MTDADETRQQLASELAELRRRVAELEAQQAARRQAEAKISPPQEWEQALNAIPDLIFVTDIHHRIVQANRAMADRLGLAPEQLIGQACFPCVHGLEQPPGFCPLAHWPDRAGQTLEIYQERLGGHLSINITPLYSADGQLIGSVHVARNINERKRIEEALRSRAARLRAVVENQGEGVCIVDGEELIIFANPASEAAFGVPRGGLVGRNLSEFTTPNQFAVIQRQTQRRRLGETSRYEIEITSPDGARRRLTVTATPWLDAEGQFIGAFGVFRDITEQKQTEAALERRAQELEALYETSLEINAQRSLSTLLHDIVERAATLLKARMGGLYLMGPEDGTLELVVSYHLPGDYVGTTLRLGEGVSGRVAQTGQPIMIADYKTWEGRAAVYADSPFHRVVGVPLKIGNRVIGVINVTDDEKIGPFSEDEIKLVNLFAVQAAVAIENARLYEEAVHAAERRATLYRATQEINASVDRQQICVAVHKAAEQVMPVDAVVIALRDEEHQAVDVIYLFDAGQRWPNVRTPLGQGLASYIITTGESLRVDDIFSDAVAQKTGAIQFGLPDTVPLAVIAAPLRSGDKVIGMLSIQSHAPTRYTGQDLELLEMLAAHVATAFENARLFEETQQRAHHMMLLNDITRAAVSAPNLPDMLKTLADRLGELLAADGVYITLYDPVQNTAMTAAATGPLRESYTALRVEPGKVTLTESVLKAGHALVAEDVFNSPYLSPRLASSLSARSLLGLPLVADGQKLGAALIGFNQPHHFTPDEIARSEQAAGQIALAVAKTKLFEATLNSAEEMNSTGDILRSLNAHPDVTQAFSVIGASLAALTGCDRASLALLNENRDKFTVTPLDRPATSLDRGDPMPLSASAARDDVLAGRTHLTPDLAAESNFAEQSLYAAGFRSRINLPLRVGAQIIGALNLDWTIPNGYVRSDLPLLGQIADAIALAIERTRLFNETKRRDAIMAALASIEERLLMSDDPATVMPQVLERLGSATGVSRAYIFENHTTNGDALLASQRFEWTAPGQMPQIDNPKMQNIDYLKSGFGRWVELLRANRTLFSLVRDLSTAERAVLEPQDIQSIAITPIFCGEQWWGFLGLDDCEHERAWSAAETEALRSAASALGAAIDRQRSQAAERDQRALAQALRDTAAVLNKTLDTSQVLDLILTHVGRVVPHDAAGIFLLDSQRSIASIWRYRDYLDRQREALTLGTYFTIAETRNLREMLETGEPVIVPDTRNFPGWVNYPKWDWVRSHAGMPIRLQGQVIGFLNLYSATPDFFISAHAERLQAFADQAAIAIENARLYAETRQHASNLTLLYGITQVTSRSLALDQVLSQALEATLTLLDFESGVICLVDSDDWNKLRRAVTRELALPLFELIGPSAPEDMLCAYIHRRQTSLMVHAPERDAPDEISSISTQLSDRGWRAYAGIPLMHQGQSLGVMCLFSRQSPLPSSYDQALLTTMGHQIATAIANAQLFQATMSERSRLQALIESSRDGIILSGLDGRILVVNAQAQQMLRLPGQPEDWLGRPARDMLNVLRRTSRETARLLISELRSVQTGSEAPREGRIESPPYTIHWLNLPVLVGQTPLGRLIVLRDMTGERAVEQLREDMTHMMVHDLRNPLASVLTAMDFMLQEAADTHPSDNILNALGIAHAQALKMQALVNRILEILQLERGQMPLNCAPIGLGELVGETLRLQSPLAEARNIRLQCETPPALPPAWADAELIGRVLQNLVGNALKFTPMGGSVLTRVQLEGGEQPKLLVSVSDTGLGIPVEIQGRLFQKFVRGRQKARGSGLGLAFCKLVLEAHGERIWVENTSAQGTTIAFSLSIAPGASGGP